MGTSTVEANRRLDEGRPRDTVALWHVRPGVPDRRLTYPEFEELVERTAAALSRTGIRKGTRVALMSPVGVDFIALNLALPRLGAVPVEVERQIGADAVARVLANFEPQAFIGDAEVQRQRLENGWARDSIRTAVTVGPEPVDEEPTLDGLRAEAASDPIPEPVTLDKDDLARILTTSGSTGTPKGVAWSWEAQQYFNRLISGGQDMSGETFLAVLHWNLPGVFAAGGTVVFLGDGFDPEQLAPEVIIETIRQFAVTALMLPPAVLDQLSRYCVENGVVLDGVKRVGGGGATVNPEIIARMRRCLPEDADVLVGYGATESIGISMIESREIIAERGATDRGAGVCVGSPLDLTVRAIRISDDPVREWTDELVVPAGTVGEITVKGPSVSKLYVGNPEATALAKIPDGDRVWHRTGDLGWFDDRGRIWLCGRKADRVQTSDGDLYTDQVEPIFDTIDGVRRSALVGLGAAPNQVPVLIIESVTEPGSSDRDRITAEVHRLAAEFPQTKDIQRVLFHPQFPTDYRHNSKIRRNLLAAWAADQPA
ncbi:AMP-binding protein [Nocardia sp. NPDC051570]|uniref:AMP-binding protein n=1 Tax=Nocardia sp. NPDC051570 TaxID=3364324 RepID=UPI0037A79F9B